MLAPNATAHARLEDTLHKYTTDRFGVNVFGSSRLVSVGSQVLRIVATLDFMRIAVADGRTSDCSVIVAVVLRGSTLAPRCQQIYKQEQKENGLNRMWGGHACVCVYSSRSRVPLI